MLRKIIDASKSIGYLDMNYDEELAMFECMKRHPHIFTGYATFPIIYSTEEKNRGGKKSGHYVRK